MKHGFKPVPGWECLFYHLEQQLFLSVYVDDFKMAGNAHNIQAMWKTLAKDINLEPPVPFSDNVYLGVHQHDIDLPDQYLEGRKHFTEMINFEEIRKSQSSETSPSIRAWQYTMVGHAEQCVDRYLELTNQSVEVLKPAATPTIDDHMFTMVISYKMGKS